MGFLSSGACTTYINIIVLLQHAYHPTLITQNKRERRHPRKQRKPIHDVYNIYRLCLLPSALYLRYSICCLCSLLHLNMYSLRSILKSQAGYIPGIYTRFIYTYTWYKISEVVRLVDALAATETSASYLVHLRFNGRSMLLVRVYRHDSIFSISLLR